MALIKLVVFDIAGTIIEDHGEVVRAFSAAFEKSGIPFTEDELKRWKGASKRATIRYFVEQLPNLEPAEKVETVYRCFRVLSGALESLYARRMAGSIRGQYFQQRRAPRPPRAMPWSLEWRRERSPGHQRRRPSA
jgi:phosphoglycolate phosphatase-like HAD superfamily hydrolase